MALDQLIPHATTMALFLLGAVVFARMKEAAISALFGAGYMLLLVQLVAAL